MCSAVAYAVMNVMGSRLSDTSRSDIIIVLIYCVLHLLQELVDVDQVVLGSDVAHWWKMICRRRVRAATIWTTSNSHRSRHCLVLGQRRSR